MDKNQIIEYLKGNTSFEESQAMEEWVLASKDNANFFFEIKTQVFVDALDNVKDEVDVDKEFLDFESKYIRKSKRDRSTFFKYAAVFMVLLSTSLYIFLAKDGILGNSEIPTDVITLELNDGKLEVLEENTVKDVPIYNQNGKVIGVQIGNRLQYLPKTESKELEFNTLTVPYGKKLDLVLSDGTLVKLNAGTEMTYPVTFVPDQNREVEIVGEAFFEVFHDTQNPFIVSANGVDVQVLGTTFNVANYPEDQHTEIVLVEGAVRVSKNKREPMDTLTGVVLKPGVMASFHKLQNTIHTEEVNVSIYTSWINGNLVFRNAPFESIARKLERRYAVSIDNQNQTFGEIDFSGTIDVDRESIEDVLGQFQKLYQIQYQIIENQIIIKP